MNAQRVRVVHVSHGLSVRGTPRFYANTFALSEAIMDVSIGTTMSARQRLGDMLVQCPPPDVTFDEDASGNNKDPPITLCR